MTIERIPPEQQLPAHYLKYYGIEMSISGRVTTNSQIWRVVFELLSNCSENRIRESDAHPTKIDVTFEPGKVTVEDNFVYQNPEAVLQNILSIRDSGRPQTTRSPDNDGLRLGGAGIFTSVKILKELNGSLNYHIKAGTIVAVGTWKEV